MARIVEVVSGAIVAPASLKGCVAAPAACRLLVVSGAIVAPASLKGISLYISFVSVSVSGAIVAPASLKDVLNIACENARLEFPGPLLPRPH